MNVCRFRERDFDSTGTEAEEVYGIVDEDAERIYFESSVSSKPNTFISPPKPTTTTDSVILIEDFSELSKLSKTNNVDISFSLGMDEWLDDPISLEYKEEQNCIILEKPHSSKLIDSAQKKSFSLG